MTDFMLKYMPRTFQEFVGEAAARTLLGILRKRIMGTVQQVHLLLIGRKGTGKTTLARLFAKGHFCTQGPDGGPCGLCETCVAFEEQFDKGVGYISVPKLPSRTPRTRETNDYRFRVFDFANAGVDLIEEFKREVAPTPEPGFFRSYAEIIIADEAHRIDKIKQEALLTSLDGKIFPSVVFCIAQENLARPDSALLRRPKPIYIEPEIGEVVNYARRIAVAEGIPVVSEDALVELVSGVGLIQSDVLQMLEMAADEEVAVSSSWVKARLPRILMLRGEIWD